MTSDEQIIVSYQGSSLCHKDKLSRPSPLACLKCEQFDTFDTKMSQASLAHQDVKLSPRSPRVRHRMSAQATGSRDPRVNPHQSYD